MTDLYDILKANRLKKESDPWLCILGEAWMSSEEDYKEYTGLVPYTFIGNGQPLISWMIKGNTVQSSTPTPDNPITPSETGDLETVGVKAGQYKIPISSANTITPIYLGEVETTRKIRKLVLTGKETFFRDKEREGSWRFFTDKLISAKGSTGICSHFVYIGASGVNNTDNIGFSLFNTSQFGCRCPKSVADTVNDFKAWLANQYAAGTPITVWYVLATPTTGIVNEPLRKIGDYADSISDVISIPTVRGENVFDVDTEVKPSEVYIKYKSR